MGQQLSESLDNVTVHKVAVLETIAHNVNDA